MRTGSARFSFFFLMLWGIGKSLWKASQTPSWRLVGVKKNSPIFGSCMILGIVLLLQPHPCKDLGGSLLHFGNYCSKGQAMNWKYNFFQCYPSLIFLLSNLIILKVNLKFWQWLSSYCIFSFVRLSAHPPQAHLCTESWGQISWWNLTIHRCSISFSAATRTTGLLASVNSWLPLGTSSTHRLFHNEFSCIW